MVDCHLKLMPSTLMPFVAEDQGKLHKETWSSSSVIGMLLYLAYTQPNLAFSVNQAARYAHFPHHSHEEVMKHICHYLHGTADKGLLLHPTTSFVSKYYLDADLQDFGATKMTKTPSVLNSEQDTCSLLQDIH